MNPIFSETVIGGLCIFTLDGKCLKSMKILEMHMPDLNTAIPIVRESVAAILRIRVKKPQKGKRGGAKKGNFEVSFGSAFCVVTDRYLLTANHVLNNPPRNSTDKFYAFSVPRNGDRAYAFPVIGFNSERADIDIAVVEIGPCRDEGVHLPAVPVSMSQQNDGSNVLTLGFPSPLIERIDLDPQGNYQNGLFFLKSSANEGIISAQYTVEGIQYYELNVGWHHGESGGPIISLTDPPSAFAIMQRYRNIQSPHGIMAGPHFGCSLSTIRQELTDLGVTIA